MPKGAVRPTVLIPNTAEYWKSSVAVAAEVFRDRFPLTGPISLQVQFVFGRPKNHFKIRKSELAGLRDDAPLWHTQTPDADNCVKAIMDALTHIGVWRNDAQVCDLHITKKFCVESAQDQGAWVAISEILYRTPPESNKGTNQATFNYA